jgi:proteasome lid subunit RPN8/RPN11
MTNPYFTQTRLWRIPQAAIEDSLDEMALDGAKGTEGIVLWLGKDNDDIADITHLVRLRGPLVVKRKEYINIHSALLNDVADIAIEHGLRLLGQVHSHPPGYSVDLSPTDRMYGIQVPFYLSLVAPDFARTSAPVHNWGVHIYTAEAGYIRADQEKTRRCLQLTDGLRPPMFTVVAAS